MYITTIHGDAAALKQGIVRVDWPHLEFNRAAALSRQFLELFCQASDLWRALPIASASVRMRVAPDAPPVSWHAITVDAAGEAQLRLAIAAFMRLDGMSGATVSSPFSVEDYQSHFVDEDDSWLALSRVPAETSAGGMVFGGMSLFALLPDLFAKSLMFGHRLDYQAAMMPLRASPNLVRTAMKSAAFLRRETAAPTGLIGQQEAIAAALPKATHLVEEAIRIAPEGEVWLEGYIATSLDQGLFEARDLAPLDQNRAEALALHVHPDVLLGAAGIADAPESVAGLMTADAAGRRTRCEPFWRTSGHDELRPLDSPITALASTVRGGPTSAGGDPGRSPGGGGAPFVFVSHAHAERGRIGPILEALARSGVQLWIDSKIHVGDEWDATLETQLTNCAGLLAFVSDDYVASKHCRRELKFADALDKTILASAFHTAPLTGGLGYIFASLQFVTGKDSDVAAALIRTIRLKMPHVIVAEAGRT